jgi:hypothetical protein
MTKNNIITNNIILNNNIFNNKMKNSRTKLKTNKLFGLIIIFLILIGAPVGCIFYINNLYKIQGTLEWLPNVTDNEKITRTKNRGSIISVLLMSSAIFQAIFKSLGASSIMLLLLYGFIMASVIGFLGDQGFGTDEGFSLNEISRESFDDPESFKAKLAGVGATLKFMFGTLSTNKFWKYIITVFLDMFISSPIQSIILAVFNSNLEVLNNTIPILPNLLGTLLNFIIKNFDNVLQSFVGFITFLAYTNDTRFKWAYPGDDISPDLLISTPVIKLSTAIAGIIYLIGTISADFNIMEGITFKVGTSLVDRLDRKTFFVLTLIGLLTVGSMNKNSFLEKSNNKYYVKPIFDISNDDYWHTDIALNKFINQQNIKNQKLADTTFTDSCSAKQNGLINSCKIDTKTGTYLDNRSGKYNKYIEVFILCKDKDENDKHIPILNNSSNFIEVSKQNKLINNENIDNTEYEVDATIPNSKAITLSEFIKNKGWDENKPCFVPDHDYICNCKNMDANIKEDSEYGNYTCKKETFSNSEKFNDANNKQQQQPLLNENKGTFAKKVEMGVFRTHDSNIEDKYKIIKKGNKGFGIFCFYIFIGIVVPFIPLKFIYSDDIEFKKYARVWKVILITLIIYFIAGILFYISSKCPDIEDLKQSENKIINK